MYVYDIGYYSNPVELANSDDVDLNRPDNTAIGATEREIINAIKHLEKLNNVNYNGALDDFVSNIVSDDAGAVKNWTDSEELVSALNIDAENLKYILYWKCELLVVLDCSNLPKYNNRFDDYAKFVKSPLFKTAEKFLKEIFSIEDPDEDQPTYVKALKVCDYWNVYNGLTFSYFDEEYNISLCEDSESIIISCGNNSTVVSEPNENAKTLLLNLAEKDYLFTYIDEEENPCNSTSEFSSKDSRFINILSRLYKGESVNIKIGFTDKTYTCTFIRDMRQGFSVHDNNTGEDYNVTITKFC